MSLLIISLTYLFTNMGLAVSALNNALIAMALMQAFAWSPKLQSHPKLGVYFGIAVTICESSGILQFVVAASKANADPIVRLCGSISGFAMGLAGLAAYFFLKGAAYAASTKEEALDSPFPLLLAAGAELMVILLFVVAMAL